MSGNAVVEFVHALYKLIVGACTVAYCKVFPPNREFRVVVYDVEGNPQVTRTRTCTEETARGMLFTEQAYYGAERVVLERVVNGRWQTVAEFPRRDESAGQ